MIDTPPLSPEEHEAEVGAMPHEDALQSWQRWKGKPNPDNMALVLRSVRPIIDRSVANFPKYNPAIMGGEAKRLAIAAIKTYDPAQGTKLTSHLHNHLKSMGRFSSDLGTAVRKSRQDKERTAAYMGAVRDLTELNNQEPNDDDLADHLGVNHKMLGKFRQAAVGEAAEGQLEYLPGQEEDPRMALWSNYVYHDLTPRDKKIMDYKLGRNGHPTLHTDEIAAKLGIHPDYVNRKAGEIANRILDGANGTGKTNVL